MMYDDDGKLVLKPQNEEETFTFQQKLGAGIIAAFVMFLYALKNGILRLRQDNAIMDTEDDDDYWE